MPFMRPRSPPSNASTSCSSLSRSVRQFHATHRREALPLVPAFLGIIKSASALTIITAISRVMISFLPLGTLATLKLVRGVRWMDETMRPNTSHDAEEFWKMWCQDEKGIRLKSDDAKKMVQGRTEGDDFIDPDGRRAYMIPMPQNRFKDKGRVRREENIDSKASFYERALFFLPDLPPASISYFNELTPDQRAEVNLLRRHWVSLRIFKDSLWRMRLLLVAVLGLPIFMLCAVYLCGLERVPLSGRWRLILLTPEEEDAISASLAGANWYRSVINLLTTADHPAPPVVPYQDWRWRWVEGVLRRLETAATADCQIPSTEPRPVSATLVIPPSSHPLKPRPRVSSMLHAALPGSESTSGKEHLEVGPPYNIMLLQSEERNAFSYGFGGKGAGGLVIFTGLLDYILRDLPPRAASWNPFASPPYPEPTEEQTLHLATVIAHEMGHLLLSHHLETLSQQQVLWPSMLGLALDVIRAWIWPFTLFLGPWVNDALANVGRTSTEQLAGRYGHIGFEWKHEYEADLAGIRMLALAGYDPRDALAHFSRTVTELHEIQPDHEKEKGLTGRVFKLWTEATHPSPERRTQVIQEELDRWEQVR
ncbi:hypothetical protein BCR39DRAFT_564129 [Naematelia encephala]|uniref:Peptidase M48 domain-containing protein n=1 Tax=Naematelia encephala TaxID=71784 RepID=A0A1Y2BE78_9TREE|nr:hypothetical protein BCR39DRAFT_564129 [Naematelia encephala]